MRRDWRHCAQKNRIKIKKMGVKYRRKVQGRVVFKVLTLAWGSRSMRVENGIYFPDKENKGLFKASVVSWASLARVIYVYVSFSPQEINPPLFTISQHRVS